MQICPWGRDVFDYLLSPKLKTPGHLIAYFNEHGISHHYTAYIDRLFALAGDQMHSYVHKRNRAMPPEAGGEPYQLSTRLDFVGTYKFILITEATVEHDWIEPDFSQALLAGAVPVCVHLRIGCCPSRCISRVRACVAGVKQTPLLCICEQ